MIVSKAVAKNQNYNLQIGNFKNPPYLKAQSVQIRINYNDTTYSAITKNLASAIYTPGSISFKSLTQSSQKVGERNVYSIEINPSHSVPRNGLIIVNSPTSVNFVSPQVSVKVYGEAAVSA